jgi:hypothetical protein
MPADRTLRDLDTTTLAANVPAKDLLPLQIIHLAMTVGVVMLCGIVGFLAMNGGADGDAGFARILTTVVLGLTAVLWLASDFLWKKLLSPETLLSPAADPFPAAMARIRVAWVIRLGMREAPALLGLMVLVIAATGGLLAPAPSFLWLNAAAPLLFLAFCAATVPTRERIARIVRERIGEPG